jgi:hypothetical protein
VLVSTSDQVRVLVKEDRKDERSSEREEHQEEAQGADKDWLLRTTRTELSALCPRHFPLGLSPATDRALYALTMLVAQ